MDTLTAGTLIWVSVQPLIRLFRYGILIAGGWGNVGDIPTAVVMSMMASSPFNGTGDEDLAVAYLAVFVLVFCITLFTMGNVRWIEMDYHGPDLEDEEVRERLRTKQRKFAAAFVGAAVRILRRRRPVAEQTQDGIGEDVEARLSITGGQGTLVPDYPEQPPLAAKESEDEKERGTGTAIPASRRKRILKCTYDVFRFSMTPPSLSIIISFIISVVPTLKALFVPGVPGVYISPAPDGQPPLAILMNTATFIGAASVPFGLISLGSALARLQLPHGSWKSLPFASISALAVARLVIMPILGVLICQGLTHIGLIDPKNNVLRFVCMYAMFLCKGFRVVLAHGDNPGGWRNGDYCIDYLTDAVLQVYFTQVYSGTGTATHLAAYLIPQYVLMFGTMTGLTMYTLHLLFG
ncbi:hypothetical protein ID866_7814 [Astraeus odoratus]|nr:hypothetical protein ID866_7814 [Astraeus odoratus]